ncbi:hypothetical protein PO124_29285 [Bacillus licheniformis]|nr:hypothetical protein [Bacillus licheniformis]
MLKLMFQIVGECIFQQLPGIWVLFFFPISCPPFSLFVMIVYQESKSSGKPSLWEPPPRQISMVVWYDKERSI